MKNNEKLSLILEEIEKEKMNRPLSYYTMNTLIFEDNPNNNIRVYDTNLFDNMNIIKYEKVEDQEFNSELFQEEKNKKKEKEKSDFESYISKFKNIISDVEKNTNEIKLEMEVDQKKKEDMIRNEKERLEMERQRIAEEERKKIEEQERLRRIIEENERLRKIKEEEERKRNEANELSFLNNGGRNIKERLINAGKNFENIKNEIKKINGNTNDKIIKINKLINDTTTNKTTSIKGLDKPIKSLNELLKDVKDTNNQELYLYTCFCLLRFLYKKLNEGDSDMIYENSFINAKIILALNCKTLTYMFFQRISNKCPYIIPLPYSKEVYDKLFQGKSLEEIHKLCKDDEYSYFIFLYLDINKYENIIENYISNIELFAPKDITFLISNSFFCFMDVFGNYIIQNKKNWINRIIKIKENIMEGLKIEHDKIKNSESTLISINKSINIKIESCFNKLKNNQYTNFMEKFLEIKRSI